MDQIQIARDALLGALTALSDIVNPKPIEVCGHVLLESEGGALTARATDTAIAAKVRVCEFAGESFPLSLPHREVAAFVRALPAGAVTLRDQTGRGVLSNGNSSMQIGGLPAVDFPAWTAPEGDVLCRVAASAARDSIGRASACALDADTSYIRAGAVIEFATEGLSVQATDGARLFSTGKRYTDAPSALLPKRGLHALCKALAPIGDDVVSVRLGENWCWWEADGLCFAMRRLHGTAPNMRRVLDARKKGVTVDIRAEDLRRAMGRVAVLARGVTRGVLLEWRNDALSISIETPEGAIDELVPAELQGGRHLPVNLRISANFVAAVPDIIAGDTLRLATQPDASAAVTFTSPDAVSPDEYVVMPLRG